MTNKSPREAAQILCVSYAAILQYLSKGVFPGARKVRGTRWEIPDAAVEAFKKGRLSCAGSYREHGHERRLREWCEACGLRCVKFSDPARRGAPDRIVLGLRRTGGALFVETKTPIGKLSPHQKRYHRELRALGFTVITATTFAAARLAVADYYGIEA